VGAGRGVGGGRGGGGGGGGGGEDDAGEGKDGLDRKKGRQQADQKKPIVEN